MNLHVAFRVDASAEIGTGHLIRCLTLADELRGRGASVRFICRPLTENLRELISGRGNSLSFLDPGRGSAGEVDDATETAMALADGTWHWIVVDQYALGGAWERAMRATGARLLAVDDLADREHDCDVLLDQNYLQAGARRYAGKVPAACQLLVGPRYALLRPEYRDWRERRVERTSPAKRLLVFFGGTDPWNMSSLAVEALTHPDLAHLAVDLVTGADPTRREALDWLAAARPGTTVHGPRPHLADLMSNADLALGAGGSTTWERMCLGLRSLVITIADNQVPLAKWLAHEGLIRLLGPAGRLSVQDVRAALVDESRQAVDRAALEAGMALCDGEGVHRVANAMLDGRDSVS